MCSTLLFFIFFHIECLLVYILNVCFFAALRFVTALIRFANELPSIELALQLRAMHRRKKKVSAWLDS